LEKKDYGKLGFNIHHDGVVADVELNSLAHYRGLKPGSRIVRIGDDYVINLDYEQMIHILTTLAFLKVTLLMPNEDGSARSGQDGSSVYQLYAYLSTCSSTSGGGGRGSGSNGSLAISNERVIDSTRNHATTTTTTNSMFDFPITLNQKGGANNQSQQFHPPFLSNYSPPKPRRLTITSNFKKKLKRFSGSINTDDAASNATTFSVENATTTTTTTNNNNDNEVNQSEANAFANSIYQDRMSTTSNNTIIPNRSLMLSTGGGGGYVSMPKAQYVKNEKNKENTITNTINNSNSTSTSNIVNFKNNAMLNGIYLSPIEKSENLSRYFLTLFKVPINSRIPEDPVFSTGYYLHF
jgi:hypothetical protein